ncbi:MAG: 2-hydroxyacid dehydrogenase [Actinomycetes bacterium]
MTVWVPYEDAAERLGRLPDGLGLVTGDTLTEDALAAVDFWVPSYMGAGPVVEKYAGRMPSLRVVQTLTAGVDDVLAHVPDGVTLCNARGVHDASTAELTLGLILASQRGIDDFARAHTTGTWLHGRRPSLADRTVLLVGYGAVAGAVERRLAGFEVDVLRAARTPREGVAGMEALPELLPSADVVVLTVPLTEETRGLADAAFLARMKDGALLVNVARGPVVDTDALLGETTAGRLRAALDVTDPEPLPPDHPLWRAPGVLVSPHVGGNSTAFLPRAYRLLSDQLRRYAAGEPLANVVAGPAI